MNNVTTLRASSVSLSPALQTGRRRFRGFLASFLTVNLGINSNCHFAESAIAATSARDERDASQLN